MKILLRIACLLYLLNGSVAVVSSPLSSERWVIWSEQPAEVWEDAFVTGNGRQGMMIFGRPGEERITCVHEELFIRGWDRHKLTVPHTAGLMPEVRRLMRAGESDKAAALLTDEADRQLRGMGALQRWPLIPHPAFDLLITPLHPTAASNYRRQLDLETGEALASWQCGSDWLMESAFSSRAHDVNVVHLRADKGGKLNIMLRLAETPGREGMHFDHDLDHAFSTVESGVSVGWLTYHAAYSKDPGGYTGVARVLLKGGRMTVEGATLKVEDAREVLLLIRIVPQEDGQNPAYATIKKELSALPTTYRCLLKLHAREHACMFNRMQLDLGCAAQWKSTPVETMLEEAHRDGVSPLFLEQVQAMGRYLLISSCGKFPPPLQGIWGGGWKPAWIGGFVWDSNLNLAISAASITNLPECAETYNRYIESLLPGWRLNAKNYLGCRGFVVAHYNDPTNGYLTHFGSSFPWMFWAGGAGWNIRPLYEYAMLTGNMQYLEKTVYPLYREMAEFYEDYLTEGEYELYHIELSISPENAPVGTNTWLSKDATMDIAIAREVFSLLCQMGHQFHADSAEMAKWKHYLDKLPAYRINEDGALAEWIDPRYKDIYNHRHNSHLYPVFPGIELVGSNVDSKWREAARVALAKRFQFDTSSAHGLIHLALQATRLKDTATVRENIERFSKRNYLYRSLVTSHEPGRVIYNLDAILSFPRLLAEMLVFTKPGHFETLPSWPDGYPDGNLKGIRIYGGHTLDMEWKDGRLVSLVIHPIADDSLEWEYHGKTTTLVLTRGKVFRWNA